MLDYRVLIIEDEAEIRELLKLHFDRLQFEVTAVGSGEEALVAFKAKPFPLVVVDWMMPGMSGVDLIRSLRVKAPATETAILMVTAKGSPSDVIVGLDAGADDYLTKPFDFSVLSARTRALFRRIQTPLKTPDSPASPSILVGELLMNTDSHEVTCRGEKVLLTPSEFKLLHALLQNRGKVMTRQRLIDCVQGEGIAVVDRAIDTHVFGLRKKIGACSQVIETVRGVGYRVL